MYCQNSFDSGIYINPHIGMLISVIFLSWHNASIYNGYRAHIFDTKKFCLIKRHYFFMQKIHNLNFVKTTKIQHKLGFVITHCIVGYKSIYIEVYFWRETLQEISTGQIGYCCAIVRARVQQCRTKLTPLRTELYSDSFHALLALRYGPAKCQCCITTVTIVVRPLIFSTLGQDPNAIRPWFENVLL